MADFPSYWSPSEDGPVQLVRDALSLPEGWVQRFGRYDAGIGQWVERPSEEDITALRAAYKDKMGKKAFAGWDAAEIKARMA